MSQPKRRRRDCDFDLIPPRSTKPAHESTDLETYNRIVTDTMHCHQCQKRFSARIDYRINGNHVVICPYCGHEHCRVIENGRVTSDRWQSRLHEERVVGQSRWTDQSLPIETNTVAEHVRRAWMDRVC